MKIVCIAETFPRNTSYLGVMLPKFLAREGVEVHLLTLDLPPYWNLPGMRAQYEELVGKEWLVAGSVHVNDGYTVHVMEHRTLGGFVRMRGLGAKLRELKPDVVYSLSAIGWLALEAAFWKMLLDFKLFTGSHTAASMFPMYRNDSPWFTRHRLVGFLTRWIPGRFVSLLSERCHAPTVDCAEIAWRFFGVQQRKVEILHLGVDTDVFYPVNDDQSAKERVDFRAQLGFADEEVVVVYTGKLVAEKRVDMVVSAVRRLKEEGFSVRALVVGAGPAVDSITAAGDVLLVPYQPYQQLGKYYRACDIAVWPSNESTSMLDAAACGLPIVVSDGIVYREHVDGNGLVCRMGDLDSLVSCLRELMDPSRRRPLGREGARKMAVSFSWPAHAKKRLAQYRAAISAV